MIQLSASVPRSGLDAKAPAEGPARAAAGHTAPATPYAFTHGDFAIQVVSDGYLSIPEEIFTADAGPRQRAAALSRMDSHAGIVRAPANVPVVRWRDEIILFDIGAGSAYQPSDGRLPGNLRAAGIDPAAVTRIVFTHAHPDHVGATCTEDGALRFPNATYHVGAAEWDFWMDPDFATAAPAALQGFGQGARRALDAVRERALRVMPGDQVVPGIRALDTAGHTPGHLSFELEGGDGLIIVADAATSEVVSFEHPRWTFGYDALPDVAIANRRRLLDRAAAGRHLLLGFHWTYPGIGFAEARGASYRFAAAS